MNKEVLVSRARDYLETLCAVKPNRRTGSAGNREAVRFVAERLREIGLDVQTPSFHCFDYVSREVVLRRGEERFSVFPSPYSPGCAVTEELLCVETVRELEECRCRGKLLLLRGEITEEQLMPKNFPFYNPEEHRRIYGLLEKKSPAAVITATRKNPEAVGALDPFPMIVDGDFPIPSVYCSEETGTGIAVYGGEILTLRIDAERIPAEGSNVIARFDGAAESRIVFTAHIDAYEDSPGAADDASGVVALIILAEIIATGEPPSAGIEIAILNGEDHYSTAGELDYLSRYGEDIHGIRLLVNLDDVGYRKGGTRYSFYECPEDLRRTVGDVFAGRSGFSEGPPWYQGDHMVFAQQGVPAVAFASDKLEEFMAEFAHTAHDTPDLVDCGKLVDLAMGLADFTRALGG